MPGIPGQGVMNKLNWDDLKFVLAVYRHGSMSAAARHLESNVATVSRRIERLASDLGDPLFWKREGKLVPTGTADHLVEVAEQFERNLSREVNNAQAAEHDAVVDLTIAASPPVIIVHLLPKASELISATPRIRPTFEARGKETGLGAADLLIAHALPEKGRLVGRRIGRMLAAPYRFDGVASHGEGWVCRVGEGTHAGGGCQLGYAYFKSEPTVRVTGFYQQVVAMRATGLPGMLPVAAERLFDGLIRLGGEDAIFSRDVYAIFHETRRQDVALRRLVDWAAAAFDETLH